MESSLLILIPLSLLLVFAIGLILWWSVRSGQFDDLEGPAYRVVMDDDNPPADVPPDEQTESPAQQKSPDQRGA